MAEYGSRSARHLHALDLAPKQVITLVPPTANRACVALEAEDNDPRQSSQRDHNI
jgi:hypothetical protein